MDLGTLGGSFSAGNFINRVGQIVGSSMTTGDHEIHAFLYSRGAMKDLGTLPGSTYSEPRALNDRGHVAGVWISTSDFGAQHCFLYTKGPLLDLGNVPGGTACTPAAINSEDQVAGTVVIAGYLPHAFLYDGKKLKDLGTLGGSYSIGRAINSDGLAVGSSSINGDLSQHAFLYSAAGGMRDLNSMVDHSGALSGVTINSASVITDEGLILVQGDNLHSYVLRPR